MKKSDWTILKNYGVTPDTLTVGGSLDLRGTGITALPDTLTVGRYLDLRGTGITNIDVKKTNPILSWQNGKYIKVDDVFTEVIQKRGNIYKVKKIGSDKVIYLVGDGSKYFAHGENLKKAKEDLQFKIIAEKLKNDPILPNTIITVQYYRIITGACETGVKMWMQDNGIEKESYKASELLPLLEKTNAYGLERFKSLVQF